MAKKRKNPKTLGWWGEWEPSNPWNGGKAPKDAMERMQMWAELMCVWGGWVRQDIVALEKAMILAHGLPADYFAKPDRPGDPGDPPPPPPDDS